MVFSHNSYLVYTQHPNHPSHHVLSFKATSVLRCLAAKPRALGMGKQSRYVRAELKRTRAPQNGGGAGHAELLAVLPKPDTTFMECSDTILLRR